jgi:putative ABC transport system permease protein
MSPREPVSPQFYTYDSHGLEAANAAIRFRGVPRTEMMQRLQAAWRTVAPDNPFVAKTADERLADFYQPDQQRARLFSAGAVLAIAIACVGLYGLASFNTARRVHEIGIRKVLGASTRDVLLLLVGQFIRPVLIANLIAWPIAWAAMRSWLAGFDQRIALSPLYFIAATLAALLISILTVLGQAWRVAHAEPARALRYE